MPMKWLWIGFAIVWALSIFVDSRRRARTSPPQSKGEDAASAEAPLPALLTPRGIP